MAVGEEPWDKAQRIAERDALTNQHPDVIGNLPEAKITVAADLVIDGGKVKVELQLMSDKTVKWKQV